MSIFSMQMEKLGQYRRLAGVDAIERRCFANNAFDGILTIVGVIIGSYVAWLLNARIVLITGLATCMARGVS